MKWGGFQDEVHPCYISSEISTFFTMLLFYFFFTQFSVAKANAVNVIDKRKIMYKQ